jgi:hypothetical protein
MGSPDTAQDKDCDKDQDQQLILEIKGLLIP